MFRVKRIGIILSSICLVLLVNGSLVFADEEGHYFRISGLVVSTENQTSQGLSVDLESDTDTGIGIAFASGMRLGDNYRGEVEYAFRSINYDINTKDETLAEVRGRTHALMANVAYDMDLTQSLSPYVGGGVGMAWEKGKVKTGKAKGFEGSSKTQFAYQVLAGINYNLIEQLDVVLGYRFFCCELQR